MEDLRIVLIVAGLIAIGGLLGHGVWSSKKNRSSIKKKIKPIAPAQGSRDPSGFDEDGVGPVRKVADNERQEPVLSSDEYELDPLFTDEPFVAEDSKSDMNTSTKTRMNDVSEIEEVAEQDSERKVVSSAEAETKPVPPRRGKVSEFMQSEPEASSPTEPEISVIRATDDEPQPPVIKASKSEPEAEPQINAEPVAEVRSKPERAKPAVAQDDPDFPPQVFVLYVEAAEGILIQGDHLLKAVSALGLRFGYMDFFHRDIESNGTKECIYSMANMLKPGTFDMDSISELRTRGVSLFMHVPGPQDPIRAHTQMLSDAQSLAQELGCRVLDAQRNPLSEQSINYDQQRIREHLLQARLAQVETEY